MKDVLQNIEWVQVISTLWTVVMLPILTFILKQINEYAKAKKN